MKRVGVRTFPEVGRDAAALAGREAALAGRDAGPGVLGCNEEGREDALSVHSTIHAESLHILYTLYMYFLLYTIHLLIDSGLYKIPASL